MRNKTIVSICIPLFLIFTMISSCINFQEWDKENIKESDLNDKGLPIAIYTSEPEEKPTPENFGNSLEEDDCSLSNKQIDKWMRDTLNVDTLLLTAYQSAYELYQNPSDSGKLDALDWQKRTLESYNFMKEYQDIPSCLLTYHNLMTDMLSELTSTFSEIVLVYVAMDTSEDFEPYLNEARTHLYNAYKISELKVDEWERLGSQYFDQTSNEKQEPQILDSNSINTPTNAYRTYFDDYIDIEFNIPEDWDVIRDNLSDLEDDKSFNEYLGFEGYYPKGYLYGFLPKDRNQIRFITLVAMILDEKLGTEDNIYEWVDSMESDLNDSEGINNIDSKIIEIDNFPFATLMYEAISEEYGGNKMFGILGKYQTTKFSYLFQLKSDFLCKDEMINHLNMITSTLRIR